ncbi:hypothetical protein EU538_09150 [Candidatus Thorarchaeota archaeon]|nr:MAG: hypothetical protein EU538_09150 [Candidatus Thorarchaeota archaeon]
MNEATGKPRYELFERYFVGLLALLIGITVIAVSFMGPLVLGVIQHRTSPSGVYQIIGQDLADMLLLGPLCMIGGILFLLEKPQAKYILVLTPVALIYKGLTYGLGQEYTMYAGNIESFFWYFLAMVIAGLIIGMKSLTLFDKDDAPDLSSRGTYAFVVVTAALLFMFFMMWAGDTMQVISTGDTPSGSYSNAPMVFWAIRYLDLGLTIPLGFVSLYLILTRPKSAYPVILLFFGFFITLGTAVNAMGWYQFLSGDPELQLPALGIFGFLGALTWAGFIFLVKDKVRA